MRALQAGCDLLLYPHDAAGVAAALEQAAAGAAERRRLDSALARRLAAVQRAAGPRALTDADLARHHARAGALAREAVRPLRGRSGPAPDAVDLVVVDDDEGAAYPVPPRTAFAAALRERGVPVAVGGERVVLVFSEVRGGKGRTGLSPDSRRRLAAALARPATVFVFAHPRLAAEVPGRGPVWGAWSGDAVMQAAAAERLLSPTA